jgi:tetratricopeptide (TPR) repeat protein
VDTANQIKDLIQRGLHSEALNRCKKLVRQQCHDPDIWYLASYLNRDAGNNKAASEAIEQAVELAPEHHPFRREQSQLAMAMKDYKRAAVAIVAIPSKERDAHDWKTLAQAKWQSGDYQGAVDSFKIAYEQHAEGPVAARLVQALFALGYITEGQALIDSHLQRYPPDPQLLLFRALLQAQAGETGDALNTVMQSLKIYPAFSIGLAARHVMERLTGHRADALPGETIAANDPGIQAMLSGFEYQFRQIDTARLFAFPVVVLRDALEQMPEQGLIVECGVYWGRSLRIIAAHDKKRQAHGFDSFQGLPEAWKTGEPKGSYSTGGQQPEVPENVELHSGWFEHTLPAFAAAQTEKLALLHIDCDLFSSTVTILESLRPLIQVGTIIVLDDYLGFPGYEEHEFRALKEFCDRHYIRYQNLSFALLAREAALRITQIGSVE